MGNNKCKIAPVDFDDPEDKPYEGNPLIQNNPIILVSKEDIGISSKEVIGSERNQN